jgi:formamidopyrimidine-DNA glycosylase
MPELPEVEGFRVFTERHLVGRTIVRARALDTWMLKDVGPRVLTREMSGRHVGASTRRGKVLFVFTEPPKPTAPVLCLHFGMTGFLLSTSATEPVHRWDRLLLELDDATVFRYRNQRRLGFIRMVARSEVQDLSWGLGPDPLEAPASWYVETLGRRRGPVKAVLLDQSFLAGMGNIFADESLFAARIRPDRASSSLAPEEARRLHRSVGAVLRKALRDPAMDSTPRLPLMMVRREASRARNGDGPVDVGCPRCGRPLITATIGGRTAYFCEACQT